MNPGLVALVVILGLGIYYACEWIILAWHSHPIALVLSGLFALGGAFTALWGWLKNRTGGILREVEFPNRDLGLGKEITKEGHVVSKIHIPTSIRTSHAQVIGTTGSGKTESVILPWAVHDIRAGHGLLIIDGKGDTAFLDKLVGYISEADRLKDFRLFSLSKPSYSYAFNPLSGTNPQEAAERVFSSFKFENEYYRQIQRNWFVAILSLIDELDLHADFALVSELLLDAGKLELALAQSKNQATSSILRQFLSLSPNDRIEKVSGLLGHLGNFVQGDTAELFSRQENSIDFDRALAAKQICYFQLPTMYFPTLGEASGKLVLQAFQSAVARRQLGLVGENTFFSCYLDDFQDYIYPGFGSLLNKSRSANVGVVFSHQAFGDLEKVSPEFRNVVFTNTNIKVVMRCNDPITCETFAKSLGTERAEKNTKQVRKMFLWKQDTGMGSIRDVEEYKIHPNEIRSFPTGKGVVTFPTPSGVAIHRMAFDPLKDTSGFALPKIPKMKREAQIIPGADANHSSAMPKPNQKSKKKGPKWNKSQTSDVSEKASQSPQRSQDAQQAEVQPSLEAELEQV